MKFKIFIAFLALSVQAFSQRQLSAKDAVFEALANNFDVQVAHLNVAIAEKNNAWSEAGLFPTVELGVSQNNAIQDNSKNPFTFTPGLIANQSLTPTLSMNWNLFSGLRVLVSKERLELLENQSKGNALVIIENTTQDVIQAYYSAQLQAERMKLYEQLMKASGDKKRYYDLKEKYASSTSLEALQFKNQYLTDSTNYILQKIGYDNALRNLLLLMNSQDSTLSIDQLILTDSLNFDFPLLDRNEVIELMLNSNQNLKNQYISLELQKRQVELQRSFLYPTLTLQAGATPSYGWFRSLTDDNLKANTQTLTYYGNLQLRYTLFNNWKNKRAVEVAKIQEEISTIQLSSMEKTLISNMDNLLENYEMRSGLLAISEENMEYATKAWEIALRRFQNGTINSIDITTFQTNYQNTLIQHFENQYNKLETYLEIYKMVGNLGLDFLKANE